MLVWNSMGRITDSTFDKGPDVDGSIASVNIFLSNSGCCSRISLGNCEFEEGCKYHFRELRTKPQGGFVAEGRLPWHPPLRLRKTGG